MVELNLAVHFRFQFTLSNFDIIIDKFFSELLFKKLDVVNWKKLLLKQTRPHVNMTEQMIFGQAA